MLACVSKELSHLERRDWELWMIVSLTGILVGAGLLAILFPAAFLKQDSVHFEITVSRQLVVGLITLLILLNTYVVTRRLELRRVREKLISTTIQHELVRLQSFTDPLTEIYNRRSLEEMASRFISHASRLGKPLTFMLIDVDSFKDVNTRFGHLTGDFVLAEIATLLKSSVRGADAVIRYGGDEFLVILADASRTDAWKVIERVRAYLGDWNQAGHLNTFQASLSFGVSEWSKGKTLDEVLDTADRDMYESKSRLVSKAKSPSPGRLAQREEVSSKARTDEKPVS
jgi:diguanylate cyclase (GGDEF)-like protein